MLKDFAAGVKIFFRGVTAFYSDRSLWSCALVPFLCTCCVCIMLFYAAFAAGRAFARAIDSWMESLPDYLDFLSGLLGGTAVALSLLLAAVIAISLLGILYECFGGLFFDSLIDKFSYKYYGIIPVKHKFGFDAAFFAASAVYGLKTLLISIPLLLLCLVFPVGGQIIFAVIMGYRFGMGYPVAAGYCRGVSFGESFRLLQSKTLLVSGFGITSYVILMLFPLAVIILLPGIVLGGVILFEEKCRNGNSEL